MNSGHTLLTVIVNHGYADDVMAEARKAGAAGGTILNARGTGKEEDVKFFGITLVPEKEMLLIVAENAKAPAILEAIQKGATREELIQGVRKSEDAGLKASVTFITGMGGKDLWREHALDTASMISEMEPSYVGLLTLMVEPGTPLYEDIRQGRFVLLSPEEVLLETELMLQNIQVNKTCIFRSNHASNYLSLAGDLPHDKEAMLSTIRMAKQNSRMLKDDRYRML